MKVLPKYNIIAILAVLLLAGCTRYDEVTTPDTDGIETRFTYTIPGMTAALTRGETLDESDEYDVNTVDVLVYEVGGNGQEILSYRQWASGIDAGNYSGSFKVKLAKSTGSEKYTMDFIFNARDIVNNAISAGDIKFDGTTTRSDVQKSLVVKKPHWDISANQYLPMWAAMDEAVPIQRTTTFNSALTPMRSVARLNVGVNIKDGTAQGLDNFNLSNVYYTSNAASEGYLIPDKTNLSGTKAISPTLTSPYSQTTLIEKASSEGADSIFGGMYLFELDANTQQRYGVIFEGDYTDHNGTGTYFYRLEFNDPYDAGKRLDFLRNHRYLVNIIEVTGPGYPTLAQAIAGKPGNVVYELSVNETGDINHIVYSEKYMLGVSKLSLSYEGKVQTGIEDIKVTTNYDGGWGLRVTKLDDVSNDWIKFDTEAGGSNTKATAKFNLQEYPNNDNPRTAIATFSAGTLSLDVKIEQYGRFFITTNYTGTLMKGDGDEWEVYVWGQVPANGVLIRAASNREGELQEVSRNRKFVSTGWYNQGDITEDLEIFGNAWIPMKIRDILFQYSTDNGNTWRTFMNGPQDKGHFTLGESGRVVALYDYKDDKGTDTFTWAEAMGIGKYWDTAKGNEFYYQEKITQIPEFPWPLYGEPGYLGFSLSLSTNRNSLYYVPDTGTGCADYEEPGYEEVYPKGGWRLPSLQELFEMYQYIDHIGDLALSGYKYWSSTDQQVTGATYGGSYYAIINPPGDIWFPSGQESSSSSNRIQPCYVRCVYGDPVFDVILERYPGWYYNPNGSPND